MCSRSAYAVIFQFYFKTIVINDTYHVYICNIAVEKKRCNITFSNLKFCDHAGSYTCKSLTSCSKSAKKLSTSCLRTACPKLSTSMEQLVNSCNKLVDMILSDLLQGCSNKSDTVMI